MKVKECNNCQKKEHLTKFKGKMLCRKCLCEPEPFDYWGFLIYIKTRNQNPLARLERGEGNRRTRMIGRKFIID
jgi:hypothetical protein